MTASSGRVDRPNIEDILDAERSAKGHVVRTPLLSASVLRASNVTDLRLKAENLQTSGAFKVRGALNALSKMSMEERSRGVITVSAGNHGIALSYAASVFGSHATVVMPDGATKAKVAAIQGYGGKAVLVDGTRLMESMADLRDRHSLTFIHPFDHPHVIAGQGTVGLEIVEQAPDVEVVVVPVGGGGLISGIATAVKARRPNARIVGVEPEGSTAVSQSLAAGQPISLKSFATVADGLNAPWGGPITFSIIQRLVDEVVIVSDDEIIAAVGLILDRLKLLVEPAGAAAVAAIVNGRIPGLAGKRVVAILSGGNIDRERLVGFLAP